MRLKTFFAPNMKEAMAEIRDKVGPDAIIVSNARGRGGRGITVTVAIEPELQRPANPPVPTLREQELSNPTEPADNGFDPCSLDDVLAFHRLPEMLAAQLKRTAMAQDDDSETMALSAAFDAIFRFAPLPDLPARPLMMIGPSATGKTLSVAKLAARAMLRRAKIRIITVDVTRAGAVQQLETFASLLKCPVELANSPEELAAILAETDKKPGETVTIIDSPGTNPYNAKEIANLSNFIVAADLEPVLVLAAGGDAREAAFSAEVFAGLGARRAIFTGLDSARRYGGLLSAADTGRLSFADLSLSPYVADGLHPINPATLARLVIRAAENSQSPSTLQEAIQ